MTDVLWIYLVHDSGMTLEIGFGDLIDCKFVWECAALNYSYGESCVFTLSLVPLSKSAALYYFSVYCAHMCHILNKVVF